MLFFSKKFEITRLTMKIISFINFYVSTVTNTKSSIFFTLISNKQATMLQHKKCMNDSSIRLNMHILMATDKHTCLNPYFKHDTPEFRV